MENLRHPGLGANYDRLLDQIKHRVNRQAVGNKIAVTGGLLVCLMAVGLYLYSPPRPLANDDLMASYVFNEESIDGPLLNYVFE